MIFKIHDINILLRLTVRLCFQANEMLQGAKSNKHGGERDSTLREALKLYKQITPQIDLPTVCNQFGAARYYSGIVDLSLTAAGKRDPKGLALHYYKMGEQQEDIQGMQAYLAR